ncbi:hypothetical protein LG634_26320 [Streptomyces bambusae]|uniref:hypothetical protein n=1 Tax=Streptomyces bambusae TaxID=1550616 RepID=UPI001CFD1A65|nr:hypothetical protein [Streptomyces bambusae]MCB5168328.1 hypothetical protein [Streptomyces bambusae]
MTAAATIRRGLAATGLATALASALLVSLPATAQAAPAATGGDVIRHDSIQNLYIAKDIKSYNAGQGSSCAIWNWNGGSSSSWVNPGGNCTTASMNGHTYSWNVWWDTDAFTLRDESYWLNMHGTWHRVGANVYTKITDAENAHCYRESDGVNCYVQWG